MRRAGWIAALLLAGCGGDDGAAGSDTELAGSTSTSGSGSEPTSGAPGSSSVGGSTSSSADDSSSSESGGTENPVASARLYNVTMGLPDPRWDVLSTTLSTVQLPSAYTLEALVPEDAQVVTMTLDGNETIDTTPPFLVSPDAEDGSATPLVLEPGPHTLNVMWSDGQGGEVHSEDIAFEWTTAGTAASPGPHTIHRMWRTSEGAYVMRDDAGNFVDNEGTVVFTADRVSTQEQGAGQGHILIDGSDASIVFAFIVALPDGFDPAVPYPLLVFLHHGWDVYRGTDNDGLPLDAPLFAGDRSIIADSAEHARYPAIVLIPQMRRVHNVDGVTHEWASFTSITDDSSNSAPEPSSNAGPVLDVVDLLEAGALPVAGQMPIIDGHRIYLAGHSMGGLGSWDLLARMPDRWAAGVPMAGYADHERAKDVADTPIWAFHHENDCYNAASGTQAMADMVGGAGGTRLRYTLMTFDTGGACDQAHFQTPGVAWGQEPGLFEWLFGQLNDRR